MNIFLGMDYSNPFNIGLNPITKNWVGFLKLYFTHPLKNGLSLLRGEHVFVMELEGRKWVIGKFEKGFELVTNVRNLQLHIKGDTIHDHIAHNLFHILVHGSYYKGQQFKFLTLTKLEVSKD